ncbi:hypothetical protein LDC_1135 [sediment metagenome]|uniref:Uncharacterized protein n=1 Tax=sediment metagenome TaxID=749907 RepID=D9PHY1_9ZZZZ
MTIPTARIWITGAAGKKAGENTTLTNGFAIKARRVNKITITTPVSLVNWEVIFAIKTVGLDAILGSMTVISVSGIIPSLIIIWEATAKRPISSFVKKKAATIVPIWMFA